MFNSIFSGSWCCKFYRPCSDTQSYKLEDISVAVIKTTKLKRASCPQSSSPDPPSHLILYSETKHLKWSLMHHTSSPLMRFGMWGVNKSHFLRMLTLHHCNVGLQAAHTVPEYDHKHHTTCRRLHRSGTQPPSGLRTEHLAEAVLSWEVSWTTKCGDAAGRRWKEGCWGVPILERNSVKQCKIEFCHL